MEFTPYYGWKDIVDPNNPPEGARPVGAADLLRYEGGLEQAANELNAIPGTYMRRDSPLPIGIGAVTTGLPGSLAQVAGLYSQVEGKFLIDFVIPRGDKGDPGSPGSPGAPGAPGTAATITSATATTGAPGTSATVSLGGTESSRTFAFTIPRGDPGAPGAPGTAATITSATATTGEPGTTASVSLGGTSTARTFTFTIPRGDKGDPGTPGANATLPGNFALDNTASVTLARVETGPRHVRLGHNSSSQYYSSLMLDNSSLYGPWWLGTQEGLYHANSSGIRGNAGGGTRDIEINAGGAVLLTAPSELRLQQMGSYTGGTALVTYQSGTNWFIRRSTSTTASKAAVEKYDLEHARAILNLEPVTWIDRAAAEAVADHYDRLASHRPETFEEQRAFDDAPPLTRLGGFLAEEVEKVGLVEYVQYDVDQETGEQEVAGIAYDRMWGLLVPITRDHDERIEVLETKVAAQATKIEELEERLARLEALLMKENK